MYLQKFREKIEQEQLQRHFEHKEHHKSIQKDFRSDKGRKKLLEVEGKIR